MIPMIKEGMPTSKNGGITHQSVEFMPSLREDRIIEKVANKVSIPPRKINRCHQNIFPVFFSLFPTKKLISSKKFLLLFAWFFT
jgi:hypothetical protein